MFVVAAFIFFDNCRCRVQPEIDVPGHSGWQYGKPELVACPAYEDFRGNGRVLDPTNEAVYDFLQQFMVETASLFPDPAFVRLIPHVLATIAQLTKLALWLGSLAGLVFNRTLSRVPW